MLLNKILVGFRNNLGQKIAFSLLGVVASISMSMKVNAVSRIDLEHHLCSEEVPAECQILINKTTGDTACYALLNKDSGVFPKNTSLYIKGPLDGGIVKFINLPNRSGKAVTRSGVIQTKFIFSSPLTYHPETLRPTAEQYLLEHSKTQTWSTKSGSSSFQWISGPCRIRICSDSNATLSGLKEVVLQ